MAEDDGQQTVVSDEGKIPPPVPPLTKGGLGCLLGSKGSTLLGKITQAKACGYCLLGNRGFALISVIIILALMGIATGVATSFAHRLKTSRRQSATEDELKALKEAILGNPREYSKEGRSNFGYLGDMGLSGTGQLPALADLYTKGTQPTYGLDATTGQGRGWAGPYITPILREDLADLLEDPYGNTYNYTMFTPLENAEVAARIRSFGPNKTNDNGTGDDKQIEILRKETLSTVSGYVLDSTGAAISNAMVTLYYPVAGSVSNLSTTTNASGLYQFPANAVPYGVRTVVATASPTGDLKYAEGSALAIDGNNLSFNVTNWGQEVVTVTSIQLTYTFAPTGYYQEVYVGAQHVFQYNYDYSVNCPDVNNPLCLNYNSGNRRGTGNILTISPAIIIPVGTGASSTIRILVASDNVQLPNIVLNPKGGGRLNIRYLNFCKNQTGACGGPPFDANNKTFTVILYNGATAVLPCDTSLTSPEDCDNGIDDDGDGLIDCNDPDCHKKSFTALEQP